MVRASLKTVILLSGEAMPSTRAVVYVLGSIGLDSFGLEELFYHGGQFR